MSVLPHDLGNTRALVCLLAVTCDAITCRLTFGRCALSWSDKNCSAAPCVVVYRELERAFVWNLLECCAG